MLALECKIRDLAGHIDQRIHCLLVAVKRAGLHIGLGNEMVPDRLERMSVDLESEMEVS